MSVNEKMTAIADTIRNVTGGTEALTLDDMASGVNNVYDKGYKNGVTAGYTKGKADGIYTGKQQGIAEGIEEGRALEHSDFWDAYQLNGVRTNYYRAFGNHNSSSLSWGWNEVTFRPKYDIKPSAMQQGFVYLDVGDLDALLKECGVVFDTQNCTAFQQAFQNARITVFPTLHLKECTDLGSVFANCPNLHTVRKIIFESGAKISFASLFTNCTRLANIDEIEGSIEHNISFSSSPLTGETMKRIILHLKDYSTDAPFTYTLTLKDSCKTALQADTETVKFNGEDYTYFELITAKGWNLA